jgi:hypothetical protein
VGLVADQAFALSHECCEVERSAGPGGLQLEAATTGEDRRDVVGVHASDRSAAGLAVTQATDADA